MFAHWHIYPQYMVVTFLMILFPLVVKGKAVTQQTTCSKWIGTNWIGYLCTLVTLNPKTYHVVVNQSNITYAIRDFSMGAKVNLNLQQNPIGYSPTTFTFSWQWLFLVGTMFKPKKCQNCDSKHTKLVQRTGQFYNVLETTQKKIFGVFEFFLLVQVIMMVPSPKPFLQAYKHNTLHVAK